MTTTQKTIKYLAIALAIFLIVSIISGIVSAIIALGRFITDDDNYKLDNYKTIEVNKDFNSLHLDIAGTNVIIKKGDELKVETNNKYIYTKYNDNKLTIKEEKNYHLRTKIDSDVIVYIPEGFNLEELKLGAGAGTVEISDITVNKLDFDQGAGKAIIKNTISTGLTDIDGGAGSFEITNSELHNLDLDMGAGKLEIEAKLTGKSDIDCGVGEAIIKLIGTKKDYSLKLSKGLGSITVDGNEYSSNTVVGDGDNYVEIDGGVGALKIMFNEKEVY